MQPRSKNCELGDAPSLFSKEGRSCGIQSTTTSGRVNRHTHMYTYIYIYPSLPIGPIYLSYLIYPIQSSQAYLIQFNLISSNSIYVGSSNLIYLSIDPPLTSSNHISMCTFINLHAYAYDLLGCMRARMHSKNEQVHGGQQTWVATSLSCRHRHQWKWTSTGGPDIPLYHSD